MCRFSLIFISSRVPVLESYLLSRLYIFPIQKNVTMNSKLRVGLRCLLSIGKEASNEGYLSNEAFSFTAAGGLVFFFRPLPDLKNTRGSSH